MPRLNDLVVFLGPSLPRAEATRLVRARMLPPARQGDVWKALALLPKAICLIDGLFESTPSVWHREILDALGSGVAVFGAASLGALRAAELHRLGMVGVGEIFSAYARGEWLDDSDVALLHAGAEHDYRPLTVALVNVRHEANRARAAGALSPSEARSLVDCAREIFYQERTWRRIVDAVAPKWSSAARRRWPDHARSGFEDLKAKDARLCLQLSSAFIRSGAPGPRISLPRPSSLMRRTRLRQSAGRSGPPTDDNLRRLLIASWLRSLGIKPTAADLRRARRQVRTEAMRDPLAAERRAEDLALDALALRLASRLVPDGPSLEEASW
jgi:hypothetical protein